MKQVWIYLSVLLVGVLFGSCNSSKNKKENIQFYLSTPDKTALFSKQDTGISFNATNGLPLIEVNEEEVLQEMDGFGFSLTGGSAYHIYNMSVEARKELLNELFRFDENNIGISYLRISVGASDLDAEVFSYNDLPEGETDENMDKFSLGPDREYLIPVLQEILEIYPEMKIMASPWSPPIWMKTNKASKGGSLMPKYYSAYAKYFIKYVQEMASEGITIDAITVQNEPLHPGNNPSLLMLPKDQADFVKNHLGPAFKQNNISTKIVIYDHNADRIDYPISIMDDPDAKKYIEGSAFHLYGGTIDELTKVHNAHPNKSLYFTEQWIGAPGDFANDLKWHVEHLIVGATRNWCKTVLEWNLAADPNQKPHTPGGCTKCLGAITIDGDKVIRNPAYYIIAHASKFVRPGSTRIGTNVLPGLANVAFRAPNGNIVLVVLNTSDKTIEFNIQGQGKFVNTSLANGAVGTYVW